MIRARVWTEYGITVFVTGTQDPAEAEKAVIDALEEYALLGYVWWEEEYTSERHWAENQYRLLGTPRLAAGRIVPDEEYGWLWWEGQALDRPGAFFALIYETP